MKKELGQTVEDQITGFTGVVTGRVEYISGCNQVLVTPKIGKDGSIRSAEWFDEQRVLIKSGDRLILENGANPGFDKMAPKR